MMNYHKYMLTIATGSFCSWFAFILLTIRINPYTANSSIFIIFYLTLFLALSGSFTLISFYLKLILRRTPYYYRNISIAFRQGILISLATCILLAFQSVRLSTWWETVIVIFLIALIELTFSARFDSKNL